MRRIELHYEITGEIKSLISKILRVRDLGVFFGFQNTDFKTERAEVEFERLKQYFPEIHRENIPEYIQPESIDKIKATNILKAFRLFEKGRPEKFSMNLLKKIHSALLENTPEFETAGTL